MSSVFLIVVVIFESFDLNSPWIPIRGSLCFDIVQHRLKQNDNTSYNWAYGKHMVNHVEEYE